MKSLKVSLVIIAAMALMIGLSGVSFAFHSGGVAECEGCHSMHSPDPGGSFLLVGDTQSSTCLTCHGRSGSGSYHIATPPADLGSGSAPYNYTPGGDFGWLEKTYVFIVRNNTVTDEGATHGHDINAGSYANWGNVSNNATAPGGTFPQNQLACNSCHDPHGQFRRTATGTIVKTGFPIKSSGSYPGGEPTATEAVGVYRLLAGAGYTKDGVTFGGVPAAKVPSTYNRSEDVTQTRASYGVATTGGQVTWGNWCATCHPDMHSSGNYVHPIDQGLGSTIATIYGQYVKSGDMTGSLATSYSSLNPFAKNSSDYVALGTLAVNDDSQLGGPVSADQVMCLSCHRAHASGFAEMLRFKYSNEFMTTNGYYSGSAGGTLDGRSEAEWEASYNGRKSTHFATFQRVLCNKCHGKD